MCLSIPGKIIKIAKGKATVDYGAEMREAAIVEDGFAVGDYVIVQGKIVIQKIPDKDAKAFLELITQG